MELIAFAKQNRLTVRKDDCGDPVIRGKFGELYEYSDSLLGVMLITPVSKPPKPRHWYRYREAGQVAAMVLQQNGDAEGALSFDPKNAEQVKIALKLAGVKPKRRVSPEERARLQAIGYKRGSPALEDGLRL